MSMNKSILMRISRIAASSTAFVQHSRMNILKNVCDNRNASKLYDPAASKCKGKNNSDGGSSKFKNSSSRAQQKPKVQSIDDDSGRRWAYYRDIAHYKQMTLCLLGPKVTAKKKNQAVSSRKPLIRPFSSDAAVMGRTVTFIYIRHMSTYADSTIGTSCLNKVCRSNVFYHHCNKDPLVLPKPPKMPSVTKVLEATKSAESVRALKLWRERMIHEMGWDRFNAYQKEIFRRGSELHSNLEQFMLHGETCDLIWKDNSNNYWKSFQSAMGSFTEVEEVELKMVHPMLRYQGVLDCVGSYKGNQCIIDWKTSEKRKTSLSETFDNPLQVAAYIGMWNHVKPDIQIDRGILVMLYADGSPCDILVLEKQDLLDYWKSWLHRLTAFLQNDLDSAKW